VSAPRYRVPDGEIDPRHAYAMVHDDLMLEGNPRLNLATCCTTWLAPESRALMDDAITRNIVEPVREPRLATRGSGCASWGRSGGNPYPRNPHVHRRRNSRSRPDRCSARDDAPPSGDLIWRVGAVRERDDLARAFWRWLVCVGRRPRATREHQSARRCSTALHRRPAARSRRRGSAAKLRPASTRRINDCSDALG
jgi:hypothetical protein